MASSSEEDDQQGGGAGAEDSWLSSKLNKMSHRERLDGLHDIHGVSDLIEETPAMLRSRVVEMNRVLRTLPFGALGAAYKKAMTKSPDYVEYLKIPCLRAKEYDSKDAVGLLNRLLQRKLELFGEENLVGDIHLKDLNEEDTDAMQKGLVQTLKERDRAGRAVILVNGILSTLYSTRTVMRLLFYSAMFGLLDDEDTQKRGVVFIYYGIGQEKFFGSDRPIQYVKTAQSIPFRIVAHHICSDNPAIQAASHFACWVMDNAAISRYRLHFGTSLECIYKLMTFGIPKEAIPVSMVDGTMDLTWHHSLLKAIETREEKRREELRNKEITTTLSAPAPTAVASSSSSLECHKNVDNTLFLVPRSIDVLMGRGRHPKNRPGAQRMHNLVVEYKEDYDSASKSRKTAITKHILQCLKNSGSRFLTSSSDGSGYIECEDTAAHEKIAHTFRNHRLKGGGKGGGSAGNSTESLAKSSKKQHYKNASPS